MTGTKSVRSALVLGAAYLAVALFVTAVWTWCARTEVTAGALEVIGPRGEQYSTRFNGIVALVEGRSMAPFVKRRLLPDLTRLVVWLTPPAAWHRLEHRLQGDDLLATLARGQLERLNWRPEHYPILFVATFLIGCSVLGFMFACRRLVQLLYHSPSSVPDVLGGVLGFALLGGNGDWHYLGYPYDFPNAFVFTLALIGLLQRRWWFLPAFVAAVYSKETAVLLILADLLLAPDRRSPRFWLRLCLLAGIYAAIRHAVDVSYPALEGDFWMPRRNAKYLALRFFYMWWLPLLAVGLARLAALWRRYPAALRRLCLLAVPLLGMASVKGWIEEQRQYLELLPIVGPIVIQWALHEAGFGHLLQARQPEPARPAATGPGRPAPAEAA